MSLSPTQFREQVTDRWAGMGVHYDPAGPRVRRITALHGPSHIEEISPSHPLHTDQENLVWDDPRSSTPGPITVLRHKGKDWVEDGHHRLARARMEGQSVKARVYSGEGYEI